MKRPTKAQKEATEKLRLSAIVHAVYSGAMGGVWDGHQFATAEILSRAVPALQEMFPITDRAYMWSGHSLRHFDTAATATEHLYTQGIRA